MTPLSAHSASKRATISGCFIRPLLDSWVKTTTSIRERSEGREELLSPCATRSSASTRDREEEPDRIRTEFQRDRDRILHSNSFRRLKHKTQVFIAPVGDHYVTRLTHTLEVAQIARTISRALNLNEDLAEAIALGHDLGHTPFGHVGEDELGKLHPEGFRHAEQSLRIVEKLEKGGAGLNLTREVRQGILNHSKPRGDFIAAHLPNGLSLEGHICRISDAVAYLNHDLLDAFRAGVITWDDVPDVVAGILGSSHSQRINTMVSDVVESSWAASGEGGGGLPEIAMSGRVRGAVMTMREFMFEKVYLPKDQGPEGQAAREIMSLLYGYYGEHPDALPPGLPQDGRQAVDHVAGMSDLYAIREAERIRPGQAGRFANGLLAHLP